MSKTPRADLWFSLVIIALAVAVVIESWRMPRFANLGIHPMSVPGLTPGALGAALGILGMALFLRSLRGRKVATATDPTAAEGWLRLASTLAFCLLYAVGLLGWLPFWLATAIFVFAFVLAFTWRARAAVRAILTAGCLAIATSAAVTLLFERVFLVRLP